MMCVGRPVPGHWKGSNRKEKQVVLTALQRGLLYSQRRAGEFVDNSRQVAHTVMTSQSLSLRDPRHRREHEPGYESRPVPSKLPPRAGRTVSVEGG